MRPELFESEFKNKIVLVTGGSGQIGACIIEQYQRAGASVVVLDVEKPQIDHKDLLKYDSTDTACYYVNCDISQRHSVETSLSSIFSHCGNVDILINCAGISVFTPFEERSDDEFKRVMDVNIYGTFVVSQVVVKHWQRKKFAGNILNFGSIYGVSVADQRIYGDSGRNSPEVYAISKAGIIHFTRYLARYLADFGIRVNCLSPGGIYAGQKEFFVNSYVNKTPLGRMGKPEDLIGAAFYLTSSMSEYVTGHNLLVDGGFTIGD